MSMSNKPRVNHRRLPHTTMSMRDKSVIDELHLMIILKVKVIFSINQNFWMSYSNDHFFYKTMCLLWEANFQGLTISIAHLHILSRAFTIGNVSTTYPRYFTLGGIYSCLLSPDTYFHFYVCNCTTPWTSSNGTKSTNQSPNTVLIHIMHSHLCHGMFPCIMQCNAPLHYHICKECHMDNSNHTIHHVSWTIIIISFNF